MTGLMVRRHAAESKGHSTRLWIRARNGAARGLQIYTYIYMSAERKP